MPVTASLSSATSPSAPASKSNSNSTTNSTNPTGDSFAVLDLDYGVGLFATRDIARGSRIFTISGRLQSSPTRYSIQLDESVHIEADDALPDEEMRRRHPWRFLNHSCDPNARIQGRSLLARRAIAAGEQIRFDYTTTEAHMAEPFLCRCASDRCVGEVRGFAHLSPEEQSARASRLAPHLKSLRKVLAQDAKQDAKHDAKHDAKQGAQQNA